MKRHYLNAAYSQTSVDLTFIQHIVQGKTYPWKCASRSSLMFKLSGSILKRPESETSTGASSQNATCQHLLTAFLSKFSARAYYRSRPRLQSTYFTIFSCGRLYFLRFLFKSIFCRSSIASHISAIIYALKVMNIDDPTHSGICEKKKKIIKACQC